MIYLYYGQNSFLIEEKLKLFRERYQAKFSSGLNFWKIDLAEENLEMLQLIAEVQSMFEEKKLIFVRGVLGLGEVSWNKLTKFLAVKNLFSNEEVIFVFYEFFAGDKDPVAAFWKRIEFFRARGAKMKEFKNFSPAKLLGWVHQEALKLNLKINRPELEYLIERTGGELYRLLNELKKLSLFKDASSITYQDIENLVAAELNANIFDTIEALAKKNPKLALANLNQHWTRNEDPLMVFNMIIWQFRNLVKLVDVEATASPQELARRLKMNPWVARKTLALLRNFSLAELKRIYQQLMEMDVAIKTGRKDGREALEDFVYSFLKL